MLIYPYIYALTYINFPVYTLIYIIFLIFIIGMVFILLIIQYFFQINQSYIINYHLLAYPSRTRSLWISKRPL